MSNIFEYKDPIIYELRSGTADDPFVPYINILYKVINSKVLLNEIPDPTERVQVRDPNTGQIYFEVEGKEPSDLEFHVDYTVGIVTFNPSAEGKTLSFTYYGRGQAIIPASRIWTKEQDGEVVQRLSDIIDAASEFVFLGEYSHTTTYKRFNIVTYNGVAYIALQETVGNDPPNETYWGRLTGFRADGIYSPSKTYYVGDVVSDSNNYNLYYSLINNNINNQLTDTTKWQKIISVEPAINNANNAATNANNAATNANNAATNANNKANYAQSQGDYAKSQGDYAKSQGDYAKGVGDSLVWRGLYNPATSYVIRNIVGYQGLVYMCIQNTTGNLPTNTAYWVKIAGYRWMGTYSTSTTYAYGDIVVDSENQNVYISVADNNLNQSLTNTSYWQLTVSVQAAIANANNAAANANSAATNADTKATYAQTQGDYAKTQGDYAKSVGDSLVWKGNYSASTSYVVRNIVYYQGSTYICIQNTTGNPPTNATYWAKITGFRWMGTYSTSITYVYGDTVVDSNQLNIYQSLQDGNFNKPLTDTTYWQKLLSVESVVNSANTATTNANNAASSANTAATNANNAATNANNAAAAANNIVNTYVYKGVYDPATSYVVNNQVQYNGSTYRCIQDSIGNPPTDTNYWVLVAAKGEDGQGTIKTISSANSDISVSGTATDPVLTLNSGNGANQIVKRNSSAEIESNTVVFGKFKISFNSTTNTLDFIYTG